MQDDSFEGPVSTGKVPLAELGTLERRVSLSQFPPYVGDYAEFPDGQVRRIVSVECTLWFDDGTKRTFGPGEFVRIVHVGY